jgi:nucleoside-diphosphate-sugar epimerase
MSELPSQIESVAQLEDLLSEPSAVLVDLCRGLSGDLMIVGATGKVGPSLARMAKRAVDASGVSRRVFAVARSAMPELTALGVETIRCDLLDPASVAQLPKVENVVYLVGRKFGSTGSESMTWGINSIAAYHAARHFRGARIAAFSTGCVYPVMDLRTGGATEETPVAPVGEYAMSCVARERMFDFFADRGELDVVHLRLNYAVECRYGVLQDLAARVLTGEPVDVTTGYANVIWQGDCNDQALRSLALASHPATVLNITGPELFSIRQVALRMGAIMGKDVTFVGEENGQGYLNNASRANGLFGNPRVPLARLVEWVARWAMAGGSSLGKPTHFETQDGKY